MIDLTPLEVRHKKNDLRKVVRGYDPGAVDDFLDIVADRLEQLVRENLQLEQQVDRMRGELNEYRDRERALTEALVSAQELREELRTQSQREAELLRSETRQETELLLREAELEAQRVRSEALLARQREEEALRQIENRRMELIRTYRRFLERELGELAILAQTLEPGSPVSPVSPVSPRPQPRASAAAHTQSPMVEDSVGRSLDAELVTVLGALTAGIAADDDEFEEFLPGSTSALSPEADDSPAVMGRDDTRRAAELPAPEASLEEERLDEEVAAGGAAANLPESNGEGRSPGARPSTPARGTRAASREEQPDWLASLLDEET